jgi:hypothetical protein
MIVPERPPLSADGPDSCNWARCRVVLQGDLLLLGYQFDSVGRWPLVQKSHSSASDSVVILYLPL